MAESRDDEFAAFTMLSQLLMMTGESNCIAEKTAYGEYHRVDVVEDS